MDAHKKKTGDLASKRDISRLRVSASSFNSSFKKPIENLKPSFFIKQATLTCVEEVPHERDKVFQQ